MVTCLDSASPINGLAIPGQGAIGMGTFMPLWLLVLFEFKLHQIFNWLLGAPVHILISIASSVFTFFLVKTKKYFQLQGAGRMAPDDVPAAVPCLNVCTVFREHSLSTSLFLSRILLRLKIMFLIYRALLLNSLLTLMCQYNFLKGFRHLLYLGNYIHTVGKKKNSF